MTLDELLGEMTLAELLEEEDVHTVEEEDVHNAAKNDVHIVEMSIYERAIGEITIDELDTEMTLYELQLDSDADADIDGNPSGMDWIYRQYKRRQITPESLAWFEELEQEVAGTPNVV